jgi:hypothetical protein
VKFPPPSPMVSYDMDLTKRLVKNYKKSYLLNEYKKSLG